MNRLASAIAVYFVLALVLTTANVYAGGITPFGSYPFPSGGHSYAMAEGSTMTGQMMSEGTLNSQLGNITPEENYPFVNGTMRQYGLSPEWTEQGSNVRVVTPYSAEREAGHQSFYRQWYDREYGVSPYWTEEGGVAPETRLGNITQQWGYPFVSGGHPFAMED